MIRTPHPHAQAQTLMAELSALGFTLGHGQSLNIIAKVSGYKGWNEQAAHLKSASGKKEQASGKKPALPPFVLPDSLLSILDNIVSYADNTDCDDDLTVTSDSAVSNLGDWLRMYRRNLPEDAPAAPETHVIGDYPFTLDDIGVDPGYGITAARLATFYKHEKDNAQTKLLTATTENETFTLVLRGQLVVRPKDPSNSDISGLVCSANEVSEEDLMFFEDDSWAQHVHVDSFPVFQWLDAQGNPVFNPADTASTDPQMELRLLNHQVVVRNASKKMK